MTTLLELSDECSRAEAGSLDLDRAIATALGVKFGPLYTHSIDAALTLLPVGYQWVCGFSRHVPHQAVVSSSQHAHGGWDGSSDHSRPLALCAALLQAHAARIGSAA